MRADTRLFLPRLIAGNDASRYLARIRRFASGAICALCFGLVVSLSLAGPTQAANGVAVHTTENVDPRWLPWIGSWRLTLDAVNETDTTAKENNVLEIRPSGDGKSIIMKSFQDEKLLLETRIIADGSRQTLEDSKCGGWYRYSWSDTGKRLLFESEAACPAEVPRFVSGISIVTENRDWLDIQLLRSGEDRAISVRKYRAIFDSGDSAVSTGVGRLGAPRYLAGTSLSIDEVIELSRKVPSELLEAAILELRKPFKMNSNSLKRLSDAGVQPRVVDLMVAMSFPDKFTVSRQKISPVREAESAPPGVFYGPPYVWLPFGYWSIYGPYSSWYWGTPIYSYWGWGWGGYYSGHYGGHGDYSGGRLVNGRGYSRVEPSHPNAQPRYAQPRNYFISGSGRPNIAGSSSPAPSNSVNGSSGSASGGSGSSGSGSSSASPSGYHSGGNGGGTARPRD